MNRVPEFCFPRAQEQRQRPKGSTRLALIQSQSPSWSRIVLISKTPRPFFARPEIFFSETSERNFVPRASLEARRH